MNTRVKFKIKGEVILTVTGKPVKSLGKWFDTSLKDTESITQMVIQGEEWMCKIDRSGPSGMVLPTRRSTKTIVATNDLRRTFGNSGKDGKKD